MPEKKKILFVCIHNSARSQMAEAWVNGLYPDRFLAESAGLLPGRLNPLVVRSMAAVGIDISANRTKTVNQLLERSASFDYVITVCDESSAEQCPVFPGGGERLHWSFPDPSKIEGKPQQILTGICGVRDRIREAVVEFCGEKTT